MLTSFYSVDKNFTEQIVGAVNFSIGQLNRTFTKHDNTTFVAAIRSGNKSHDFSEEKFESYPCIIIHRNYPSVRPDRTPDVKPFYAALRKASELSDYKDIITRFYEPLAMQIEYEVSICAKDYNEHSALTEWINKYSYGKQKYFEFNKSFELDSVFGKITDAENVEYDFEKFAEPERSDGVMETIYKFTVYPYVVIKEPTDMAAIRDILVGLKRN